MSSGGFCQSTGGGWATELVAHRSQLHDVPDQMSDELAVMIEPAASGIHAALRAQVEPGATVAVLGAGTMGLMTVAALRHFTEARLDRLGSPLPPPSERLAQSPAGCRPPTRWTATATPWTTPPKPAAGERLRSLST